MRPHQIMFMGLIFATGTVISLTFGGLWVGDEEVAMANAVTVFKQANILDIWSITVPNPNFFLVGVKSLTSLDFAFFAGEMALLQWFLFLTIGMAMMWGIFVVVIGVIQGLFRRS